MNFVLYLEELTEKLNNLSFDPEICLVLCCDCSSTNPVNIFVGTLPNVYTSLSFPQAVAEQWRAGLFYSLVEYLSVTMILVELQNLSFLPESLTL